jgi:NitT/TauT family transport system substrate-binding protein
MMLHSYKQTLLRLFSLFFLIFSLSACGWLDSGDGGDEGDFTDEEVTFDEEGGGDGTLTGPSLTLVAAKYVPWIPWFLAKQENLFQQYSEEYRVNIQFEETSYDGGINRFIGNEVDAIAITNIDVLAQIISKDIEADVILVSSYSTGNDALLIPENSDGLVLDKSIAVKEFSTGHYLLDRYLLRNQLDFERVEIANTNEQDLLEVFDGGDVAGISSWNPLVNELIQNRHARPLFSSQEIPKEIMHLLVVRRSAIEKSPELGRALLATWFNVMETMRGNRRGATLDAMAEISGVDRDNFDLQLTGVNLTDTATKGLSSIRDRRTMSKTMRHVRFFIKRNEIADDADFGSWVSYPGRTPALLHFNAKPLQDFVAPATDEIF